MALRKTGKIEGSNLRILAIAFANNRIDRKNYLRLRTHQLSALEFSKPLPALPPELLDISVPSVKIDAPHINKKDNAPLIKWLIIALIALGVVTAAYVGYLRVQSSSTTSQTGIPTPEQQAKKLLEMPTWPPEEMEIFSILWSTLSEEAKLEARQTEWFSALKNEISNRINQLKQQRGSTDDVRDYQNKLNALRVFYAEVAAE
jgi:flagellar basal body-associated protein FliL